MQGATKHREDFLAGVSVFQDFQVTWKLRGEAQRSQGVAPNFSRPLESIYKHSNAPHVISMCSPTDSGKTRHAQQSTLRSAKAAKKKVGVINGHKLHPHHRLQIFIDSDPEVGKYGLESWHDFNMLCYFTPEKAQRYLVSKKTSCWELFENSHTSHGSISDLLMGKPIKSPKRWVEHGWAFIGAGFRSLLGHPTVRSTGIDTELGSVTSQLGRITCYKL